VTRRELLAELAVTLGARHEARFIVHEVLGPDPSDPSVALAEVDIATARGIATRRVNGEPLQYILGHWAFRTLDLRLDPRVLIPRPETEQVVEIALAELSALQPARPVIVDAGTGSGAIALSMAVELAGRFPDGQVWATDASPEALEVATANHGSLVAENEGAVLPVHFVEGNWLERLPMELQGGIDMVVSNPPYVDLTEWADLPDDVRCEPRHALVSPSGSDGTPGLCDVETVLGQAWVWLQRPGTVIIELAPHQAVAAIALARTIGYRDVRVEPDLSRRPRALVGRAP
jgi:release factor glutamine methyltransferase